MCAPLTALGLGSSGGRSQQATGERERERERECERERGRRGGESGNVREEKGREREEGKEKRERRERRDLWIDGSDVTYVYLKRKREKERESNVIHECVSKDEFLCVSLCARAANLICVDDVIVTHPLRREGK